MTSTIKQELWGGAITTQLPLGLIDASTLRQVPDTQEVFLVSSENTTDYTKMNKDDTIILDLLERVDGPDIDAVKEHFEDIAHLNDADEWKMLSLDETTNDIKPAAKSYVGIGVEPAKKWGRDESEGKPFKPALVVVLGVVRLANVETDLLVTYNVPLSSQKELEGLQTLHDTTSVKENGENFAQKRIELAVSVVKKTIACMKVESWDLFG